MKKSRIFAAVAMGVMVFSLTACSLARPQETQSETGETDRLIGVLITTEYLDLFDMEGYLEDHLEQVAQGGKISAQDSDAYQNRLYATLTTSTVTNQETGETEELDEYVFEGVEGWAYLAPALIDEEGNRIGTSSSVDDVFADTNMHVTSADQGETLELEATVYVVQDQMEQCYYINPVYQTADGAVYTQGGDGLQLAQGWEQEGEYCSTTLEHSTAVTVDGESQTDEVSVLIRISVLNRPQEIVVVQMDGAHRVLSQVAYEPGGMPQNLETEPGCAYLLIETHKEDPAGQEVISRQLVSPQEEEIQSFYPREDGICLSQWTQIEWN